MRFNFRAQLNHKKMKKALKVFLVILIIILISIQFVRPEQNAGEEIAQNQITAHYQVPADVQQVLKVSCYDCHSNTTQYPWYSKIQPVAWMLNDHIVEGKKELNFSNFSAYPAYRRYKKFKEISQQVKENDMPLFSYTIIHRDAVLSDNQKLLLENWAANSMKEMERQFPADSLVKPK